MSVYVSPVKDMQFVMENVAGLSRVQQLPGFSDAGNDIVEAVLDEAGKFAAQLIAPLNAGADKQGARLVDGQVEASPGFSEAYKAFVEAGWASLSYDPQYGGQGLPHVLGTAVAEMWQSASLAFALCPMLTASAVSAVHRHGSDELKQIFLEKLISGEWTGTMQLTEPQAGTDLAAIKTRAVPTTDAAGKPAYRLSGQKIFITWGDHQMTDNVLHLILARVEGAPEGIRGLSLFLAPKYLLDENGKPGDRNDIYALSLEHKLGIHGSPTCVMGMGDKGGALAYLVGEENQGINCMFTMMNNARLEVGVQGLAISERAFQQARAYAGERVQGTAKDGTKQRIIDFPDVRRMLMLMKSQTEAMRALALMTAAQIDLADHADDAAQRKAAQARVDLLIPVVKGWCTETAQEITGLNVQVHGGMGFIEETGAAQHYRDARILTIYEGTSGIQANDFAGRKTLRDGGAAAKALIKDIRETVSTMLSAGGITGTLASQLAAACDGYEHSVNTLLARAGEDAGHAGAAAFNLLMQAGVVIGGWLMGQAALAAEAKLAAGDGEADFLNAKLASCRFYFAHVLPRATAYAAVVQAGSACLMEPDESLI
ncbi:acyl-CoA dehydrogenase [Granulosicoccaceae sp. 1_MG-2023]|nr:acyl-CoA dehydrogenase [Granulosicoccaceae sp. 1_MG-2023]